MAKIDRLYSLDILRGLIIVLMALDHTRRYWAETPFSPTDLDQTTLAWFLTRWVTHFCAPLFIFLTGISAYLYGQQVQSKKVLRNYLLSRGSWLILLELTVVNFSWQFGYDVVFLQVIWVIGCSMIVLAGMIYLPYNLLCLLSFFVIITHNALNDHAILNWVGQDLTWLWHLLHSPTTFNLSDRLQIFALYPLIPWFAVMSLGYCCGNLFKLNASLRYKVFATLGGITIVVFALLKLGNIYGEPNLFVPDPSLVTSIMSLLNNSKYPPSLVYLLMTIGPGLLILASLEYAQTRNRSLNWLNGLKILGGVPLFYYLLHIPVINLSAQIYSQLTYGQTIDFFSTPPDWPTSYEPSLWVAYIAWVVITLALYIPCKYYLALKRTHHSPLLKYL
ncbi:DUF1624 domain-containing protein [Pseudoalteromonas obscura]|uniref:Heparan-alpha-glucosaminide N-acetyltransferase domain-containing protein n=1 Tax=Pseudoalteromonas obscura TaxID=3048491 RepID=A0ABT7EPJ0_9GAMM|nr:heparan-alpha-glucosaminide N-acetyltransferase domain-containing protein [Pseudoalteromonas sp. P94(2023)]MDK2596952.1 heparan-alpha-glucosaminide N-acetyltransferase domain-containing protein [Pseudoalteromonas sp. P94(2023)]